VRCFYLYFLHMNIHLVFLLLDMQPQLMQPWIGLGARGQSMKRLPAMQSTGGARNDDPTLFFTSIG
jgi:hypothetical protein